MSDRPAFSHLPVMLAEAVDGLNVRKDGIYVDCTAGGGGHSERIAALLTTGKLICIDRDINAVEAVKKRLSRFSDRVIFVNDNFTNLDYILDSLSIPFADGVLADLGVSSPQIDNPERGFSYMNDGPLDMRMSQSGLTAYDVVNGYPPEKLRQILFTYGEEKLAGKIASAIAAKRELSPICSTGELASVISGVYPRSFKGGHPAKRSFQAIRIEVNGELDCIAPLIDKAVERLGTGGRLSVITFHSLEDRAVKQTMSIYFNGCTCPPEFPVCVCGKKPKLVPVTKKPILPGQTEMNDNPRAHSAKLRIAERTDFR